MARGDGRTFLRGEIHWAAYYVDGIEIRESTKRRGKEGARAARDLLRRRLTEVATGQFIGPHADRITVGQVLDGWLGDLRLRGKRSAPKVAFFVTRITAALGSIRVAALTTDRIQRWMESELEGDAARGTVKLMATYLRAALRRALRTQQVVRIPWVPTLDVDNTRRGFVDAPALEQLWTALRSPYDDLARFAVLTGWRSEEYLGLTWDRVDRAAGEIRLHRSKTGGRVVPVTGALAVLIEARWTARTVRGRGTLQLATHVFHRRGRPVSYGAWRDVFVAAAATIGLPELRPHDLRRTAVRNLLQASLRERMVMAMTGHRTRAVFDRYDIVPTGDLRAALDQAETHRTRTIRGSGTT